MSEEKPAMWMPIETPPEDGVWVLLYSPDNDGMLDPKIEVGAFFDGKFSDPQGYDMLGTHWMPLPTPPSGEPER
jgi:hypothetical protein